jgi:hyperosmotically inducible periplasmic protein
VRRAAILGLLLLSASIIAPGVAWSKQKTIVEESSYLLREVRHDLRMLPYLTIFDNLEFKVDGYNVELDGEVVNPVLKSDAEEVVKKIEGVENVANNIKVLPLSVSDERLRRALFRAIYGEPALSGTPCRQFRPFTSSSRTAT